MIKVEVKESKQEDDIKYPCLMISSNGRLVLFASEGKGTVIKSDAPNYSVGEYIKTWDMEYFKPFHGTVTLSNED